MKKMGNFHKTKIAMNFWENVVAELEYKGIGRKTLAQRAGFDVSNIGKGIKNGNVPSADTAVKIAQALGVSVEYLVTGKDKAVPSSIRKSVVEFMQVLNRLTDEELQHLIFIARRMGSR